MTGKLGFNEWLFALYGYGADDMTDEDYDMYYAAWKEYTERSEIGAGDCIEIISMYGEPLYSGKKGIITYIDAIGQLHGTWGGCALIPEKDNYRRIDL